MHFYIVLCLFFSLYFDSTKPSICCYKAFPINKTELLNLACVFFNYFVTFSISYFETSREPDIREGIIYYKCCLWPFQR